MFEWQQHHAFDYLDGLLNTEERDAFEQDLAQGGPCAEYLRQAQTFRELLQTTRKEAQELDWSAIRAEVEHQARSMGTSTHWLSPWVWAPALVAGVVVLAIFLPLLVNPPSTGPSHPGTPAEGPSTLTSDGQTAENNNTGWLTLADGSQVLPSEGAIWEERDREEAGIHLVLRSGSIRAKVVRTPTRPFFQIEAGEVMVRVLGTDFTVTHHGGQQVHVAVKHGRVAVQTPAGEEILVDGQSLSHNMEHTAPGISSKTQDIPTKTGDTSNEEGIDSRTSTTENPTTGTGSKPKRPKTPTSREGDKSANSAITGAKGPGSPEDEGATDRVEKESSEDLQVAENTVVDAQAGPETPSKNVHVSVEHFTDPVQRELANVIVEIQGGNLHRAVRRLKDHQRLHTNHRSTVDALYLEGYCLYMLGNKEKAMEIWKRYESRAPNGPWLRTVRDWTAPSVPSLDRLR